MLRSWTLGRKGVALSASPFERIAVARFSFRRACAPSSGYPPRSSQADRQSPDWALRVCEFRNGYDCPTCATANCSVTPKLRIRDLLRSRAGGAAGQGREGKVGEFSALPFVVAEGGDHGRVVGAEFGLW